MITLPIPDAYLQAYPLMQNVWIQAGLIIVLTIILSYTLTFIIERIVSRITKKTKTQVDDLIIAENRHRFSLLLITLGAQLAIAVTPLLPFIQYILGTVSIWIATLVVISVSRIIISEWGEKLAKKTKTDLDEALVPLLRKALNVVYVITGFLAIMRLWNLDITPYLTGLGISGVVLGFALQDSLKNIFGGISLIFDRNFQINDKIRLEGGQVGEIKDIGLRSTKLQTYDNEIIFIPNGQLANQRIQNYRKPHPAVRVVIPFGVAYGTNVETVKKIALTTIKKNKHYDDKGPYTDVIFFEMGESSINFQARFWVKSWKNAFSAKIEATELLYKELIKQKIDIPYPTRTVHLKK